MRIVLLAAAVVGLAACSSATPYQPIEGRPYGYASTLLEQDRARVVFRGNSLTDRLTVENYLLYRAAEVTVQNGFDYFVTVNRSTDAETQLLQSGGTLRPRFGGFYSPYIGRLFYDYRYFGPAWGWRPFYDPYFADPVHFREITRFEATAEILMRKGPKPDDADAYDAREVLARLRDQIVLPKAG
jgi:hypothetical protein